MHGLDPSLELNAVQVGRNSAGCSRSADIARGSHTNNADIARGSHTNSITDVESRSRAFKLDVERITLNAQGATPWLEDSSYGATNRRLLVVESAPS